VSAPGPRYQGLILQPTYRVRNRRPVVQLYGRLLEGPAFLVEDDRFRPYFFVRGSEAHRATGEPDVEVHATNLRNLEGESVSKVVVTVPSAVPPLRERLDRAGAGSCEADIRFPYRYLIDREIRGAVVIEGEPRRREGLLVFRNPELSPGEARPKLGVLSLDLETTLDASAIFSAALVHTAPDGSRVEEVHVVHERRIDDPHARIHSSESHLLVAVSRRIRELDPDLIVGWNVVDFDLEVFTRRCEHLGLPPRECRLGRVEGAVGFQQDRGFTRQSRADVPGRMVLDGIALVRDAMRLPDYRLETVARHVLGRGKKIDHEAPDAGEEIQRLYREEPEALVAYNLEDARLVVEILEREGLLDLTLERSLLSGMQLDRVGASIASFDLLYLAELRRRGVVAPSVDSSRKTEPIKGGALLDAVPGVTPNVAVFDFKSLYPSLVRTFNLDPLALALANGANAEDCIEAPNGALFSREPAILPTIIERFMARRDDARARGARHADQAIKIMMNAMFGVFAAPACRFFDPRVANAITGFGQQTLAWTSHAFEEAGLRVVYGDTDSVFVQLDDELDDANPDRRQARLARAAELRRRVEARVGDRIRDVYGVEPRLTLELEKLYDRLFLPRVRGGGGASKKRYAGWAEGQLEIVGLESVRRDWPAVAGRLQEGMLRRIFTEDSHAEVMPFVKQVTDDLLEGKLDDELIYVKRIRKRSLDSYTASTPPHVQAARKLLDTGGTVGPIVRYVIARSGPEPVPPGRPLPADIDRRHYVERVLRPVADAILLEVGHSFDEAMGQPQQLDLL
jgi:DNA polymerase-2